MRKLEDIYEAYQALKEGEMLTSNASDQFRLKKERIICQNNGTRYSLSIEDFLSLYQHTVFYLYADDNTIDEEKDEAYYRYYRK
ncbi:MAG: hypothetical protein IIZ33_08335 [Erysipelotrichaceae bacterium]|nr:hypothetical protein [Erysipelotrichaceae bacterium]